MLEIKIPVKTPFLAHFRVYFVFFYTENEKIGYSRFDFQNLQPFLHEKCQNFISYT